MSATHPNLVLGRHGLPDLIDLDDLQILLDEYHRQTGCAFFVTSCPDKNVLLASRQHAICADFLRRSSATHSTCGGGDTPLPQQPPEPGQVAIERCANGLAEGVVPIIIAGCHLADLAAGQIFLDESDREAFKSTAADLGLSEEDSLSALDKIPVMTEEKFRSTISFLGHLATTLAKKGLAEQEALAEREMVATQETNLASLMESMRDILVVASLDGKVLYTNPATTSKLGYSPEELLATTILDWHPPQLRREAEGILAEMLEGRQDFCPLPLQHKEGHLIPVETRVWLGHWNGTYCVYGICRDLREEKEAQQRLERVFQLSPSPMALSEMENRTFVQVNDAFLEVTGYSREEVLGRSSADLGVFLESDLQNQAAQTLQDEGRLANLELQIRRKDGTLRHGMFWGTILENQGKRYLLTTMLDITERKEAENQADIARAEWERTFAAVPDLVCVVDPDYRIRKVNDAFARHLGKEPAELLGATCYESLGCSHSHLDAGSCPHARTMQDLAEHSDDVQWKELSGDFHVTTSPIFDRKGEYVGSVHVSRDMTEINTTTRQAHHQAALLNSLLDSVADLVFFKDREGVYLGCNPAFEAFVGCPREEIIGRTDLELFPAEVAQAFREDDRQTLDSNQTRHIDEWVDYPDGRRVLLNTLKTTFRGPDGELIGILGVSRDITERHRYEQAILESEQRLSALINSTPDIICFKDGQGRWLVANDADLELFELQDADYQGKTDRELAELAAPLFREGFLVCTASDEATWNNGVITRHKETVPLTAGGQKVFDVIKVPLFEENGARRGMVVLGRDITNEQNLEEQLRQAQKMEAVGQLAGGVAHDFNNLLQVILGYGDMLKDMVDKSSAAATPLDGILRAGRRASDLVSQLLAFSRRQVLLMETIDLNLAVRDMLSLLERVIGEQYQLDFRPCAEPAVVQADRSQITQIFTNLCVNSRDALASGGYIAIETGCVDLDTAFCREHTWIEPGSYVMMEVSDNGAGMDPDILERAFDPFFTTKDVGAGTGLGLSTVYGLVKQHNGFIKVESEVGRGTRVRIYLPRAEGAVSEAKSASTQPAPGGSETILVAEDDEMVRWLLEAILERAGYTVIMTADGEEAVAALRENRSNIDLALLDVVMPRLGGRAAYDRLREIAPDLKVIFASGYSMDAIHNDFVLEEGLEFLQKPIDRNELLLQVRRILDC